MGSNWGFTDGIDFDLTRSTILKERGSPFRTYANAMFPRTVREMFDYAEYLWTHHSAYSRALQRCVRYFLTKIEVNDAPDYKIKKKYTKYLHDTLSIIPTLAMIGDDLMAYGNSFTSVFQPFHRNLICPKCGTMFPVEKVDYDFNEYDFKGKCANCAKSVTYTVQDTPTSKDTLKVVRWNPRAIEIDYHHFSGEKEFYYDMSRDEGRGFDKDSKVHIENTPMEVIQCAKDKHKFKFAKGELCHLSMPPLAGLNVSLNGWGLPPFMSSFEDVVQLQTLVRFNEAIMQDYLVPFRFFSPGKSGGETGDPILMIDAGKFINSVRGMITRQRKDPTAIQVVPYPVNYQALGGEAKNLAPVELIKLSLSNLFNGMGVPREFYDENVSEAGSPQSLRMFERSWTYYIKILDVFLDWMSSKLQSYLMWEEVSIRLVFNSLMEDEASKNMKFQLLAGNQVSRYTAFSPLGVDPEWEADRIIEEQAMMDEKMADQQRRMGQSQQNQQLMDSPLPQPGQGGGPQGAPPPGQGAPGQGQPPPSGAEPQQGASIDDVEAQADQQAQQLLTMDPYQRRSTLLQMAKSNETLHAVVKRKLERYEQKAAQSGLNMVRTGQAPPPQQ